MRSENTVQRLYGGFEDATLNLVEKAKYAAGYARACLEVASSGQPAVQQQLGLW